MPKYRIFNFELVKKDEIPPSGTSFWRKPTSQFFVEQLKSLNNSNALKLTFPNYKEALLAHQVLKHRIDRAKEFGFFASGANFIISARRLLDGSVSIYIMREVK